MNFENIDIPLLIRSSDPWQTCDRWERIFRRLRRTRVCMRAQIRRKLGLQRNYYTASKQREVTISSRRDVRLGISRYRRVACRDSACTRWNRNETSRLIALIVVSRRLNASQSCKSSSERTYTFWSRMPGSCQMSDVNNAVPTLQKTLGRKDREKQREFINEKIPEAIIRGNSSWRSREYRGNSTFSPNFRCRIQL